MSVKIRMYSSGFCPFCRRAEALLAARGAKDVETLRVDLDPTLLAEMVRITKRRTVPQIFINERHVGGYDDLAAIDRDGGLVTLLSS